MSCRKFSFCAMAVNLEIVSEDSNQYILEYLSRTETTQDSTEYGALIDVTKPYLERLNDFMIGRKTCDILKELPSAGKLLSKVSKVFNSKGGIPDIVIDCIINLANIPSSLNSGSKMERKVGQWATEQLQACSVPCMGEHDAEFMDALGISQSEFVDAQIAEISSMVICGSPMSKTNTDTCCLCRLTEVVLQLLDDPRVKTLIQEIIFAIEKSFTTFRIGDTHASIEVFIDAVTKNRKLVKNLSNECQMALWRCHLPAFELEILDIVNIVLKTPFIDDLSIAKRLKEKFQHVLDFCVNDDLSYEFANEVFRASVLELGFRPSLSSLIHIFSLTIRKEKQKNAVVGFKFARNFFTTLPLSLNGTTRKDQQAMIRMITDGLKDLRHSKKISDFNLWYLLVQNRHFISCALCLSLDGFCSDLDFILDMFVFYYIPNSTQSDKTEIESKHSMVKQTLKSFIMDIRCLLRRSMLHVSDISHSIESFKEEARTNSSLLSHLLRDLVLHFLVKADASHFILRETFSMVTLGLTNSIKLDLWLRVLEDNLLQDPSQAANFSSEKKHVFSIFSRALLDHSKSEVTLDLKDKASCIDADEQSQIFSDRVCQVSAVLTS